MKRGATILIIALLIALVWMSGCADVSFGSQKIGDFGSTKDEQKAVAFFIEKYGDPRTNSGPPRFLEPMVTNGLVNNTPVNKVTKFSKDTGSIFFWVFYDNFKKGDKLTLTWTFNGKTVISLQKEAGGDFGRAFGEFLKPDSGWATGTHTITIAGGDTSATATFEIIAGDTVTVPLPFETGSSAGSGGLDLSRQNAVGAVAPEGGAQPGQKLEKQAPVSDAQPAQEPPKPSVVDAQRQIPDKDLLSLCGPHQTLKIGGECICDDPSLKACGKDCINQLVDINNCGDCGIRCGPSQKCNGGRCECKIGGLTVCGERCANLLTDVYNCGWCGHVCSQGGVDSTKCVAGACTCREDLYLCPDGCQYLNRHENCGKCGNKCSGDYPFCYYGKCVDDEHNPRPS